MYQIYNMQDERGEFEIRTQRRKMTYIMIFVSENNLILSWNDDNNIANREKSIISNVIVMVAGAN